MPVSLFLQYLLFAVAIASIVLIGLTWLEGVLVIWTPRSDSSRFWRTYDKLLLTLRYVSASEDKLARARFNLPSLTERRSDDK